MPTEKITYGKIKLVYEDSLAYDSGIREGDELISINGYKIADILDYDYHSYNQILFLQIKRENDIINISINNEDEEDIGIEFEDELFDGYHRCANNCIFCFLKQMPKGLRKSLYIRDDDFRLSFAHGNYITLTNISDEELNRIKSQRMGPLYISVQTTDPKLRSEMLNNRAASKIMDQLKMIASSKIEMHTQIVLCPGINDGKYLDRTIGDLITLLPYIKSIAIVPVGLTKFRDGLAKLSRYSIEESRQIIKKINKWHKEFLSKFGTGLIYASDEFYLVSGSSLPGKKYYEGFPQYENGVGITRSFIDELRNVKDYLKRNTIDYRKYNLVTGILASDHIKLLADIINTSKMAEAYVSAISNNYFGESVTVTGLITGSDIIDQIKLNSPDEIILIPEVMLNNNTFLDDITTDILSDKLQRKVIPVSISPKEFIKQLKKIN